MSSKIETREERNARMRQYRLENKDRLNAYRRAHRARIAFLRRKARLGDRRCMFCEVKLAASTVKLKHKKYCDGCLGNPTVQRYLKSLYIRRWRDKKAGRIPEPIALVQRTYTGLGRPPFQILDVGEKLSTGDVA